LLIAGRGDRLLTLAAGYADIIGFSGTAKGPDGAPLGGATAEEVDERVKFVRDRLGERNAEFNILVQVVQVTDDRAAFVERLERRTKGRLTAEQLSQIPIVLVGTPAQIVDQLNAHHERFGFTYFTVLEPYLDEFAPVLELLR